VRNPKRPNEAVFGGAGASLVRCLTRPRRPHQARIDKRRQHCQTPDLRVTHCPPPAYAAFSRTVVRIGGYSRQAKTLARFSRSSMEAMPTLTQTRGYRASRVSARDEESR